MAPLGPDGRFALGRISTGCPEDSYLSEDITHRKHAEREVLLGMSRKLTEAHEQECTRIGRDLHDDFVQRLRASLVKELGAGVR